MAEIISTNKIYEKLLEFQKEVNIIKSQIVDEDTIMTSEESERFDQAMKELEEGKAISHEDLKKELGL